MMHGWGAYNVHAPSPLPHHNLYWKWYQTISLYKHSLQFNFFFSVHMYKKILHWDPKGVPKIWRKKIKKSKSYFDKMKNLNNFFTGCLKTAIISCKLNFWKRNHPVSFFAYLLHKKQRWTNLKVIGMFLWFTIMFYLKNFTFKGY